MIAFSVPVIAFATFDLLMQKRDNGDRNDRWFDNESIFAGFMIVLVAWLQTTASIGS